MTDEQKSSHDLDSDDYLRVRYRYGDAEFEAEGAAKNVNQHTINFFGMLSQHQSNSADSVQLPLLISSTEIPTLADNEISTTDDSTASPIKKPDLLTWYLQKATNSEAGEHSATQHEQLLIITLYIRDEGNRPYATTQDYKEAYEVLQRIPLDLPSNLSARLSENVKRGCLRKRDEGYFITLEGEKVVEGIQNRA